jgi:integrase
MKHLAAYASWLEDSNLDWRHFPTKRSERCLFQFRGFLIQQRDLAFLKPSTTKARMAAVLQFYRFAQVHNLIEKNLWHDKQVKVHFHDSYGFSRTMSLAQSELSIPNRARLGLRLEGGLDPISSSDRGQLLNFLERNSTNELYLMHLIGFTTGCRSETIRTLKISSLENTLPVPLEPRLRRVPVGPGTTVKTKYNVTGNVLFTEELISILLNYAYSVERILRQAKADEEHKCYLFLTRTGRPYSESTFTKLMSELRRTISNAGLKQFDDFKFHQCRATFGTNLMKVAIENPGSYATAVAFVRDAMLHKYEATTWRYIKFLEQTPLKEKYAEEFFNLFTGISHDSPLPTS